MIDFTVAIRTYNGAARIPHLLDRLQTQTGTESIQWEVLIVDNNSTDETTAIVQHYQANWSANCELRYVLETTQGAAIARRRAIQEAQGTFIGFLDDDNLPAPDWVAAAHAFGQANPKVGAYGSKISPEYEIEPPQNIRRIALYFPIIERQTLTHFDTYKKGLPPGAGLTIRKQAWTDNVPEKLILQGPVKTSLTMKGEDIEALHYVRNAGWEVWYNPEMQIYHQIPQWRLQREYLIRFCQGIGLSRHRLRMLGHSTWKRPVLIPFYLFKDIYQAALYFAKNHKQLKTDTVAACEMEILLYSCLSPFFIWRQALLK